MQPLRNGALIGGWVAMMHVESLGGATEGRKSVRGRIAVRATYYKEKRESGIKSTKEKERERERDRD